MLKLRHKIIFSFLIFMIALSGCFLRTKIASYDFTAYQNATSLKAEALLLMDKATEPYGTHAKEVESLTLKVEQAYEYAKGLPHNEVTTEQWEILKDPEKNLLGGFLKRWKEKEKLSQVFIGEAKKQVAEGFDRIIELEAAKIKE